MYFQVITYSVLVGLYLVGLCSEKFLHRVLCRGPKNCPDNLPVHHRMLFAQVLSWRMLEHYLPMLLLA